MTTALGRLEDAGYVTRRVSDHDRRGRVVSLTDEGRRVIEEALSRRYQGVARALQGISHAEVATLDGLLREIVERLASSQRES
ncbi:MarR family winged helix-turn-helix transcriptional regulator [Parvularcula lutaonensis]|uniref:MarR family winged helix-turn-helix transcriptional regulator n=1 Tax=Parvularcula lutaonensis TaxID=491923 RepID=A0ABV7MCE4_9PROT|nr:winged helix DNA-binding protein [Parvularcula lutaonensis]